MKILYINGNSGGSTGTIIKSLREHAENFGFETFLISYNDSNHCSDYIVNKNRFYEQMNKVLCRIDGSDGFHNVYSTKKMIEYIKKIEPDLIHIHTIHGHFLNLKVLLNFIHTTGVKVVWTLHDCWSFTGKCSHFENNDCYKWKTGCFKCPALRVYPPAYVFDCTKRLYEMKKMLFYKYAHDITFVVPSEWLFQCYKESFLSSFDCRTINNGIKIEKNNTLIINEAKDTPISFFSAAYPFTREKGIDIISKLADSLDSKKFKFFVAGLTERETKKFSKNLISLGVIQDKKIMDYYYSSCDYFLNPTYQDTFPTVNIESMKNGTPVITFRSGGSPEMLTKGTGVIIERGDFESLKSFISNNARHKTSAIISKCLERAADFSSEKMCSQYISLYNDLINTNN